MSGLARFRVDGGMCYNRMAVRDAGQQEMAPGDVWGAAVARTEEMGEISLRCPPQKAAATPGGESTAAEPARPVEQEDASRYCPVCSQRLDSRRCKLVCNACGYYMSCADYY